MAAVDTSRILPTYLAERRRITSTVTATAAGLLVGFQGEDETVGRVVPLVEAGQAQMATLVDAFMSIAAGRQPRGLDRARYTVEAIRGKPATEVYRRPFGALGGQLAQGVEFPRALSAARASVMRLAATDLQLAQTHAARDWMTDEPRVAGYERVLGPGDNCPLCVAASTRRYYREDLMPIHERCGCTVAPIFDDAGGLSRPSAAVRVGADPEIGPRLLDESWSL